jgi:phage shock protein C
MTKKLYRKQKGKMIGGICAGLEDYLNVDVTVIRLLFIALALITALIPMFLFYIIAWIIVPVEEENQA